LHGRGGGLGQTGRWERPPRTSFLSNPLQQTSSRRPITNLPRSRVSRWARGPSPGIPGAVYLGSAAATTECPTPGVVSIEGPFANHLNIPPKAMMIDAGIQFFAFRGVLKCGKKDRVQLRHNGNGAFPPRLLTVDRQPVRIPILPRPRQRKGFAPPQNRQDGIEL
jgi:hypothetical protein